MAARSTMTGCTVSGNSAVNDAGGMLNGYKATADLTNCTISGNSAVKLAGGLYNVSTATVTLADCTISGNSASTGGGIWTLARRITLANTIIAGNSVTSGGSGPDFNGSVTTDPGFNLIGDRAAAAASRPPTYSTSIPSSARCRITGARPRPWP